ncbi:hypothetical protein [Photobacterium swingsii]|uniref:hypothetical protein n=1 Tax=Photobacterium swingsii TaxID=680026 RepID=UPI004068C5E2
MSKYLIVEDSKPKYKEVKKELISLGVGKKDIKHVESVNEATRLLKSSIFELVILDLNLPMVKNGNAITNGGLTFLNKLKNNGSKYNLPSQIIGLTSFENLKKSQESDFSSLCFSIYEFEKKDWKIALGNKINWGMASSKAIVKKTEKKIIFSVHGIRTLGHWQDKLEKSISESKQDFEVIKYKYNYFSAFQLLLPKYRGVVINRLAQELEDISEKFPDSRITIFSHSFGTYAIVKALELLPKSCELDIDNLILISSVLKSDYDLSVIKRRFNIKKIFNECGYNDNVLLVSHYLCIDMGMAGRSGFVGTHAINRFYRGGHDFFNRESTFINNHWTPILKGEASNEYDERSFGVIRENFEIIMYTRLIPFFLLFVILVIYAIN